MEVTDVAAQKRRGRYNIFIDGVFRLGLSESILALYNLYVGKDIDEGLIKEIQEREFLYRLYDRCVRKLGNRPHSERELRTYCRQVLRKESLKEGAKKAHFSRTTSSEMSELNSDILIEKTMARLSDEKLVSDTEFASWWVEQRMRGGAKGWRMIAAELMKKGVDRKIIDECVVTEGQELRSARGLVKKLRQRKSLDEEKIKRRLVSRGFSWDVIKQVMKISDDE